MLPISQLLAAQQILCTYNYKLSPLATNRQINGHLGLQARLTQQTLHLLVGNRLVQLELHHRQLLKRQHGPYAGSFTAAALVSLSP